MLDVNRSEVVEVLDVRLNPPDRHLRSSICFVVMPSAQYRGVVFRFSLLFFLRQRPLHCLSAIGCVGALSLIARFYGVFNAANVALIRSIVF